MKKICSMLLLISLLLTLASCANEDPSPTTTSYYESESEYDDDLIEEDYEDEYEDDYTELLEYVDSTCFESVGYSEDDEVLVVRFLDSGSVYVYYDVPYYEYEELIYADSIGGYYNDNIKGCYECEQIE